MGSTANSEMGSIWRRWDPHLHGPGTILNDQFGGTDPWDRYLTELESRTPAIQAIGVTDYYSLDVYEKVRQFEAAGRLSGCALIFPNIEMRLAYGTVKGAWVNIHLLVNPGTSDHVEDARRFLGQLRFDAYEDTFACTPSDLMRLGYKAGAAANTPAAALKLGAEQFKVNFEQLKESYTKNAWAKANVLIAVSGGKNDGTSGLRDAADTTLRQEVEKFAHLVFASSVAQREFWLGFRDLSPEQIKERYGGLKPCLHGSDAHAPDKAGVPDEDRYSWVKGDATFDALRQACIDPGNRAFVGPTPPSTAAPSRVITSVQLQGASWAMTPKIALNPGLVAIIGARGSGKTALADVIAAGCGALAGNTNTGSFLLRAQEHLGSASVTINWGDTESQSVPLSPSFEDDSGLDPQVRYLSQQFVEELCASDGTSDELLREIERVIFEAHSLNDRDGASDFGDLLDLRVSRYREERSRAEGALSTLSDRIGTELDKRKQVPQLKTQINEKKQAIKRLTDERAKLVAKGSEARMARLAELTKATEKIRSYVRYFTQQEQQLLTLQDVVKAFRASEAPEALRKLKERHAASGLEKDDWNPFLLDYRGAVSEILTERLGTARKNSADWKGTPVTTTGDHNVSLISDGADLEDQSLLLLEAETTRIQRLVNADKTTAERFAAMSKRIDEETAALARFEEKLADAEGAQERVEELLVERESTYSRVFDALLNEVSVLEALYSPLKARLDESGGSLKKVSFSVSRLADCAVWAEEGESLLDLRKTGDFKGQGTLQKLAEQKLKGAWEHGDTAAVSAAMKAFREDHQKSLLDNAQVPKTQAAEYRVWLKQFAQWLYGTGHITVRYSVNYDGVDIRKLSPGTRGIVLLLLYLALDDADDRPLIIDQPEENLDPKSVFDELVDLFLAARARRQVIIVTHNANLVVNTDADQIIVASAGQHAVGSLPPMTYTSGGLETEGIRKSVCDILEGGEEAFRERARRLRVRLER